MNKSENMCTKPLFIDYVLFLKRNTTVNFLLNEMKRNWKHRMGHCVYVYLVKNCIQNTQRTSKMPTGKGRKPNRKIGERLEWALH